MNIGNTMKKTLLSLFAVASLSAGASYAQVQIDNASITFDLSYVQLDNTKANIKVDGSSLTNILLTYDLGSKMLKSKSLNVFFKIFKIRYAFIFSLIIILMVFIDSYIFNIFYLESYPIKMIYSFGIYFSILLLINSLFVSLITIDKQE